MAKATARSKASSSAKYPPAHLSIAAPTTGKHGSARRSRPITIDVAIDPDLYATAMVSKGLAFLAVGDFREAQRALQSSLDFHIHTYGADHWASIDSRVPLAQALRRLDQHDAARHMIEAAVTRARAGQGASILQLGVGAQRNGRARARTLQFEGRSDRGS